MGQSPLQVDAAVDGLDGVIAPQLKTSIESNLQFLSDECLRAITADERAFFSLQWFRLLDEIDLRAIMGGDVELKFAVVSADGNPIAVCPLLRARGASLCQLYSVRRNYFEAWIDQLRRIRPELAKELEFSFAFITGYRRLLDLMQCSLDESLIVFNPLSLRSDVAMRSVSPRQRRRVLTHLVGALKDYSREQGLPLWFYSVEGEHSPLADALDAEQFERVFFTFDNQVDLTGFRSFEDYLQAFPSKARYTIRRDLRRIDEAGIRFRWVDDFDDHASDFSRLYYETYTKYQDSNAHLAPSFFTQLDEGLGTSTEAVVAEYGGEVIGFLQVINSHPRGEMYGYHIGRNYDSDLERVPFYFGLCIYEPIRRAIELGYGMISLGPALYETKTARGGVQKPLYSHFWFPRRRDRWMLQPYLQRFGETAEREQAKEGRQAFRAEQQESSEVKR